MPRRDDAGSCSPIARQLPDRRGWTTAPVRSGSPEAQAVSRSMACHHHPPAHPRAEHHRARTQVRQATINRATRQSSRLRCRRHTTTSGRARFTGREQTPPSFVQNWLKRFETSLDGCDVNHTLRIDAPPVASCQFPDSFLAFLQTSRFFPSDSVIRAQALSRLRRTAHGP
jgi:hypothetical protein